MAATPPKPVTLSKFRGINNISDPKDLSPEDLADAVNVDLTDEGKPRIREGYMLALAGDYSNLWSKSYRQGTEGYAQRENHLVRLTKNPDDSLTETILRSDLQPGGQVAFVEADGVVYYTTGIINGRIFEGGASTVWGVDRPSGIPTLSSTNGALPAGMYQVATTFVDIWGRESGASEAGTITVGDNSGISVSNIATNGTDIDYVRLYLTGTNGDTLYHALTITHGTTTAILSGGINTVPLDTQFLSAPPVGNHLAMTDDGIIYIAVGNGVFYTEPLRYHLVNLVKNWLPFGADVTMLGAVNDGLWVGADKIYWLGGADETGLPSRMDVIDDIAVPGTMAYIDGDDLSTPSKGRWLIFHGNHGIYLCGPGGQTINLTDDRVAFASPEEGAGLVRDNNGLLQYVGLHKNPSDRGAGGKVYASDQAEAQVVRNGVIVDGDQTAVRVVPDGEQRIVVI